MSRLGLLALAAQFAPRLAQVRRGTWIALGLGLLALLGMALWAAVALLGWFFGQAQDWLGGAREAASAPAQAVLENVERAVPGARAQLETHLGDVVPGLRRETPAAVDVSGTDLVPVPRLPGMTRTYWSREGSLARVEFAGQVDYATALAHYRRGLTDLGYAETVLTATPDAETHEYAQGEKRIRLTVSRDEKRGAKARIETPLP
ncbi:MAG: hypothetical protein AB1831_13935 [Pseudomonadota bacterium]